MSYNRFDKLEWLRETCGDQFMTKDLVDELVRWMGEDDFEKFYDKVLCGQWQIKREPNDPNYDEETDSMDN